MARFKEGPRIYNLFPRLIGKMDTWKPHLERAVELGFNWLYINPFHYPGFSGSLYAPKDYYEFNPMFVKSESDIPPMRQLKTLVEEAHSLGLKIIMDLVINHTAKDHPFTRQHSDWYVCDKLGNVKSPGAWDDGKWIEWGDLAEINNADSPDKDALWAYWQELVEFYIEKGFDGFRADAAYQVPADLWKLLISAGRKKNKQVRFFAESLGCTPEQTLALANAGFDYIFNSSKWWNFQESWLLDQYNQTREITPSIAFPESHDTPRLADEYKDYQPAVRQKILFSALFSSGWMIPIGMEFGFRKKTDVVHTVPEDWEGIRFDLTDFIRDINAVRTKYKIFNEECPIQIIDNDNWANIIVLLKTSLNGKEKVMLAINKNLNHPQTLFFGNLNDTMQIERDKKIKDISVGHQMKNVPGLNFEYRLEPAEVKVFYAKV